jgi:hypothetical protein
MSPGDMSTAFEVFVVSMANDGVEVSVPDVVEVVTVIAENVIEPKFASGARPHVPVHTFGVSTTHSAEACAGAGVGPAMTVVNTQAAVVSWSVSVHCPDAKLTDDCTVSPGATGYVVDERVTR